MSLGEPRPHTGGTLLASALGRPSARPVRRSRHDRARRRRTGGPIVRDVTPRTGGLAFAGLLVFIFMVYANPGNWFPGMEDIGFAKIAAGFSVCALLGS